MPLPNFFIVGAPKCGTTALHSYLSEHPNVFTCSPKEPNYFATDFPTQRYVQSEEAYLKLFASADESKTLQGEASVWYMYSQEAVSNIFRFNPTAKIIVMVRNPLEMLPSLHKMLLRNFAEDVEDLENAWELQEKRKSGLRLPNGRNVRFDVSTIQYREVCKLGLQVQRVKKIFPDSQVLTIVQDDFLTDGQGTYKKTLEFLGLPSDGRQDFPKVNVRRSYRSKWLAWVIWKIRDSGGSIKRSLGITRTFNVQQILNRFNEKHETRPSLSKEFLDQLRTEFKDDVDLLSDLIGRDLSFWLE